MEMALFAIRKSGLGGLGVSHYLCLIMLTFGSMAFSNTNHAQGPAATVAYSLPAPPDVKTIGLPDVIAHVVLFPSHVYQRASILEKQLVDLELRVKEKPTWLRNL
jgi:hypothetical protein